MRFIVNMNFGGHVRGEIVTSDAHLAAPYVAKGFLSHVNDQGERVFPEVYEPRAVASRAPLDTQE